MRQRLVRNEKRRLSRPAELLLRQLHFLLAQRRSVRFERVLLARRSEADVGAHQNKRRSCGFGARSAQRAVERFEVIAILDCLRVPAISLEPLRAVFRESQIRGGSERNVVVVVQIDQFAQFQMARQAGGFRGDALHQITVAHDPISKVTDHLESRAVVARGEIGLRDGHADPVAETLTERSRGGFHSGCELTLRMAWRQASPLAELFDLIERDIVAGKIKHAVKQHRAMPGGEDEAVAIGP